MVAYSYIFAVSALVATVAAAPHPLRGQNLEEGVGRDKESALDPSEDLSVSAPSQNEELSLGAEGDLALQATDHRSNREPENLPEESPVDDSDWQQPQPGTEDESPDDGRQSHAVFDDEEGKGSPELESSSPPTGPSSNDSLSPSTTEESGDDSDSGQQPQPDDDKEPNDEETQTSSDEGVAAHVNKDPKDEFGPHEDGDPTPTDSHSNVADEDLETDELDSNIDE